MFEARFHQLTREELHQRVWQQPMRTLAQEFGISDVAMAKACRKARVPVPPRGYWAKRAAGKAPRTRSLPVLPDKDTLTPRMVTFRPSTPAEAIPDIVSRQIAFEAMPENLIQVSDALRNPHPLVRVTREALEGAPNGRIAGYPSNWQVRHLDVEVSRPMVTRALRIMDALVKAFETRGWNVTLAKEERHTHVTILGQNIPFGIREPRRQISVPTADRKMFDPKFREEPSHALALVLREYWGRSVKKSVTETAKRPMESRLNDFVIEAIKLAHERAEWERRRLEREERERIEQQARAERDRQRKAEIAKGEKLVEEAEAWVRSHRIRDYINAVRTDALARGNETETGELGEWLSWAATYAESIDPLARRNAASSRDQLLSPP